MSKEELDEVSHLWRDIPATLATATTHSAADATSRRPGPEVAEMGISGVRRPKRHAFFTIEDGRAPGEPADSSPLVFERLRRSRIVPVVSLSRAEDAEPVSQSVSQSVSK